MLDYVTPKRSAEECTTGLMNGNYDKNRNKNAYPGMFRWPMPINSHFTFSAYMHLAVLGLCQWNNPR